MKILYVLFFFSLLSACATYKPAITDYEESAFRREAMSRKPVEIGYSWDDVDYVSEYGKTYQADRSYRHVNNKSISKYNNVTSSTNYSGNHRTTSRGHYKYHTSTTDRSIAAELAGKVEFWIAKEILGDSDYRGMTYSTYKSVKYSATPYLPQFKIPQDDVFYFDRTKSASVREEQLKRALTEAGYDNGTSKELLKHCKKLSGWHHMPKSENRMFYEKLGVEWKEKVFYQECFNKINGASQKKKLDERFSLNPYYTGRYWTPNKIVTKEERMIPEEYDTEMIRHFRGKFGKDIMRNLHSKKNSIANRNVLVLIPQKPLEFTRASVALKVHDDEKRQSANYYPIHKNLFKDDVNEKTWNKFVLNRVFKKNDTEVHYNDYYDATRRKESIYINEELAIKGLYALSAECNIDNTEIQYFRVPVSRVTYNCQHEKYHKYESSVIATSLIPGHTIMASKRGSYSTSITTLDFQLTWDSIRQAYAEKYKKGCITDNCELVDPLQPNADVVTDFAMTLAKDFPPWTYISWATKDNKGYVLHKYNLYEFDLTELYNKPH